MSVKKISITKSQQGKLYDALAHTINLMPQLLAICTDGASHSDTALNNAMEMRRVIERNLREALNER